ncbi:cation:proton antiporter [Defluviimonas sp. WL0024]|uniref:Cation:proton antiporter n=1 Tax=Albidovulum salinarum TaxID=2984153 RepID=A0ABT2XE78_9RHOB|nr:cation:proton antiporter [Defluviimonas sp. WL0024]MCU9850000.1 cation:proton antiporter [Defluviimonas sp. WL0024]
MTGAATLIAIGVLFLAGIAVDAFGRRLHVPRVTLLVLLGVVAGPPVLDLLPPALARTDDMVAPVALTMVAFLLGGQLKPSTLSEHGREILSLSLSVVAVSALVVGCGVFLVTGDPVLSLLLAGLSAATDPAATRDVIRSAGAEGRFATNILGIVAVDDAWGIILFSLMLAAAGVVAGGVEIEPVLHGLTELAGAIALGLAVGLPAAYLTGRIKPGEPTLMEALGIVFLCTGLARHFGLPYLLTGVVCGLVIVHFARHHDRPFHEIERIEWPFMLLLFVMAGAALDPCVLARFGFAALAYVGFRALARVVGGWAGGTFARLPAREGRLTGLALMPQAGVAIGMALVAGERFPALAEPVLGITIASTVAFEVFGPVLTQYALSEAGRAPE